MLWKTLLFDAFSVFFMQSRSFLAWQRSMQESQGRNNAYSLFGVPPIPSDTQLRTLLDRVPPACLYPVFRAICNGLEHTDWLTAFGAFEDNLLLALEGTEYFSSPQSHCECCSTQRLKKGQTRYFHAAVTPVMVAPEKPSVLPLAPQFITPQDGTDKQDSELVAAKRWREREVSR